MKQKITLLLEDIVEGLLANPKTKVVPDIKDEDLQGVYRIYAEEGWTDGILRLKKATGKAPVFEDETWLEIRSLARRGEFDKLAKEYGEKIDLKFIYK